MNSARLLAHASNTLTMWLDLIGATPPAADAGASEQDSR
jgi:hypothetical protein